MSLSKSDVIFSLLVLNDIAAGGDTEHIDELLRSLLAGSGWTLGESRQHNIVAVKDGVALSAFDSPLVQRSVATSPPVQPTPPDNVTPMSTSPRRRRRRR